MKRGRGVDVNDLTRIRWPLDPALSPDGTRLSYALSGPDSASDRLAYDLLLMELGEGQTRQLVAGRARRPSWSPNGYDLAYLVELGGQWQVGTRRTESHGALPGDVVEFSWSPDSRYLAVASKTIESSHVTILGADGLDPVGEVNVPPGEVKRVAWSPRGESLALAVASRADGGDEAWLLEISGGDPQQLLAWPGHIDRLAWSPEGRRLAVTGRPEGRGAWLNRELWVVDTEDSATGRQLCPGLDRSIGQVVRGDDERGVEPGKIAWSADGDGVLAMFADGGRSLLAWFHLDDTWDVIAAGDRAILDFSGSIGQMVISWSDLSTPGDLSLIEGNEEHRLTEVNNDWLGEVSLAATTHFQASSGRRGTVDCWLTEPLEAVSATPLVIQVHGGPHYPVGFRFSFDSQRLANIGLAVLRSNPRGSQGYGIGYAEAIRGDWGGKDFEDLMAVVDLASSSSAIDETRLAVIGESYGGYLTNWMLANSDLFIAGVSENGISDLAELGRGERGSDFWHLEMGGDPDTLATLYRDRSPISYANGIDAALLLIAAEEDSNIPIRQSKKLRDVLAALGKNVEMYCIQGEEHFMNVYGATANRLRRTEILDRFLLEHLHNDDQGCVNQSEIR